MMSIADLMKGNRDLITDEIFSAVSSNMANHPRIPKKSEEYKRSEKRYFIDELIKRSQFKEANDALSACKAKWPTETFQMTTATDDLAYAARAAIKKVLAD